LRSTLRRHLRPEEALPRQEGNPGDANLGQQATRIRCVLDNAVIVEAGRRLLKAVPPQAQVILFGSAARGELTHDSDLDFLVVEQDVEDRHAEQVRLRRELRPLGIPVDVIVVSKRYAEEWGPAQGSLVHKALTEGRVLHDGA
jgi:uncharacterized protein